MASATLTAIAIADLEFILEGLLPTFGSPDSVAAAAAPVLAILDNAAHAGAAGRGSSHASSSLDARRPAA